MEPYNYFKQLRTILLIELGLLIIFIFYTVSFWSSFCPYGLSSCLKGTDLHIHKFIYMSIIRPFSLTPLFIFNMIAISSYGNFIGSILIMLNALIGTLIIFLCAKVIGKRIVFPWLIFHLPKTSKLWRHHDREIVLFLRLIPFFSFDIASCLFGLLNFRIPAVVFSTIFGLLPQLFIVNFITIYSQNKITVWMLSSFCSFFIFIIPILIFEFLFKKKKNSLWTETKLMFQELKREIILNNAPVIKTKHKKDKVPILLLYGFFSSRKSLTILERLLTYRGYEIITLNLGGIFGVFYNKGIIESATFINTSIEKKIKQFKYDKIAIVAHSKGGLVALWWLLKLRGHRYCDKLITLGTPFKGSWWIWFGLITPLGLFFRDLWQMRPGSNIQKILASSIIPNNLTIYNFYSHADKVVRGKRAIFHSKQPKKIKAIETNVTHYGFLNKKEIAIKITNILK